MLRYTLRQIEYALTVHEHGSVARASEQLGVAQPTLSAAIAKLEDQLGLQLFIRHHAQGVSATPQAVRFFAEARNLLNHAQDMQRETDAAGTAVEGTLIIGSFTTIAPAFAPQLIAGFSRQYGKTVLRLEEGTQDWLLEGLRGGRHDVSLLYDVDMPGDIALTRLAELEPHILLPKAHRLAKKKRVSLAEIGKEPLILLDIAPSRTYFTRVLQSAGIEPLVAFSSPSLEVVRGLVGQGLGYSILITRPHGDHAYAGEALAVLPIAEKVEKGVIALATLKQMRKTRLVKAFEDYCRSYFEKL